MEEVDEYTPSDILQNRKLRVTMASLRKQLGNRVDAVDRHRVPTLKCSCGSDTYLITYKAARLGALGWQCVECAGGKGIRAELVDYYLYSAVRVHVVGVTEVPDLPDPPEPDPVPEKPKAPAPVRPTRAPGVSKMLEYSTRPADV